jgi:hypothetical protein
MQTRPGQGLYRRAPWRGIERCHLAKGVRVYARHTGTRDCAQNGSRVHSCCLMSRRSSGVRCGRPRKNSGSAFTSAALHSRAPHGKCEYCECPSSGRFGAAANAQRRAAAVSVWTVMECVRPAQWAQCGHSAHWRGRRVCLQPYRRSHASSVMSLPSTLTRVPLSLPPPPALLALSLTYAPLPCSLSSGSSVAGARICSSSLGDGSFSSDEDGGGLCGRTHMSQSIPWARRAWTGVSQSFL